MRRFSRIRILAAAALGVLAGIGGVTFRYAEGLSYFSTDPRACANCHIMQSQYDSWQKASHHTVAACVDCHLPHAFLPKYMAKARNGWNHSKGFTLQDFPEPILITPPNAEILHENCLVCHGDFVHGQTGGSDAPSAAPRCVACHSSVGHGPRSGLGGPLRDDELPSEPDRRPR